MSFFIINDIRLNLPMGWVPFQMLYLGSFSNVRCTEPMEQSKKSRVSAKMVDADFDALRHTYLRIVSLGEKKPVFLPLELRDSLEKLARVSGVPNLAPSHIVINILKAFFDNNRELINRKLSGEKLSV